MMPTIQASQARREETYLNPLPVRIWHWTNALGFVLLIVTGVQVRYVDLLSVMSFEAAVKWHNWIGFAVIASYFLWLGYYLFSDRITNYHSVLNAKDFVRDFFRQARYYSYGIFKGEHSPHRVHPYNKFNPMQRLTYQLIMMVAVPIQFITGILLWDVKRFEVLVAMLGGLNTIVTVHILIYIFFVSFTLIHAYMGALGKTPATHFREMFTGYEEEH
jgi:thiosulfate reductase cytochrome b subunit